MGSAKHEWLGWRGEGRVGASRVGSVSVGRHVRGGQGWPGRAGLGRGRGKVVAAAAMRGEQRDLTLTFDAHCLRAQRLAKVRKAAVARTRSMT